MFAPWRFGLLNSLLHAFVGDNGLDELLTTETILLNLLLSVNCFKYQSLKFLKKNIGYNTNDFPWMLSWNAARFGCSRDRGTHVPLSVLLKQDNNRTRYTAKRQQAGGHPRLARSVLRSGSRRTCSADLFAEVTGIVHVTAFPIACSLHSRAEGINKCATVLVVLDTEFWSWVCFIAKHRTCGKRATPKLKRHFESSQRAFGNCVALFKSYGKIFHWCTYFLLSF